MNPDALIVLVLVWGFSLFVTYWITRLAVGAGVTELTDESRQSRQLLETLVGHLVKREVPVRRVVAAAAPPGEAPARALLKIAEEQQFALKFNEARATYAALVERFPETSQAAKAKQQLENLRAI
jgi:hypothetical protein